MLFCGAGFFYMSKKPETKSFVVHQINIPKQDYYEYPEKMVIYAALFFLCVQKTRDKIIRSTPNQYTKIGLFRIS